MAIITAIAKPTFDVLINIVKFSIDKTVCKAKLAPDAFRKLVKWWNGKTIAIVGATASGKNSFYNCLLEKEPPSEHIQTRGMEKVDSFIVKRNIQGAAINLICKRSVNVGGEEDQRIQVWSKACRDADFIFYLVDIERLKNPDLYENYHLRIGEDLKWLGSNLSQFKVGCKVHLLLNKIDSILEIPQSVDNRRKFIEAQLSSDIAEIDSRAKSILDNNASTLCGVSPICMVDKDLFNCLFDDVLFNIYNQAHSE